MGFVCLLISCNQTVSPYPVYPLGVAHLAGAMAAAGHETVHFDILAQAESLADFLAANSFALVALSIRNIDTTDSTRETTFLHQAREIMKTVRQYSDAPVVVGGPAFSILPEAIFTMLQADYGVVGEGEILLPWLADCLRAGKPPEKTIYRASCEASPWRPVAYSQAIADYYLQRGGMMNIQTKRGCPYRCGYCPYPNLEGTKLRYRDPEAVADEVDRLSREFGARYIFFADAVFNDPDDHYLEVAEALIRKKNTVPWCAFFRPDNISREAIALLKKSGMSSMELGTDAASDPTLKGMHKGFCFADVMAVHEAAVQEQVPVAHFVVFGGPGETEDTLKEGLTNIDRLKNSVVFGFTGIRLLPNTPIYSLALREGVIAADSDLIEPVYYFSPQIDREKLSETIRLAWKDRFDRIFPWSEMEGRVTQLHQLGYAGPVWDLLIRKK